MKSNCDAMSSATPAINGLNNAVRLATVNFAVFFVMRVLDLDSPTAILGLLLMLGVCSYDFKKAAAIATGLEQPYTTAADNQTNVLLGQEMHKASLDSASLGAVSAAGSLGLPTLSIAAVLTATLCMPWIIDELRVAWESKAPPSTMDVIESSTPQRNSRTKNTIPALFRRTLFFLSLVGIAGLIPVAFAEPTSTRLPSQDSPTITPTITPSATSPLEAWERDRPQSWLYRSPGDKSSVCVWLCLLPLIMMGSFILPAILGFVVLEAMASRKVKASDITNQDTTNVSTKTSYKTRAPRAPQSTLPPVWLT